MRNSDLGKEEAVTVAITVNWRFVGEDEEFSFSYSTPGRPPTDEDGQDMPQLDSRWVGSVLPLTSSVLAPGLSMPVAAR